MTNWETAAKYDIEVGHISDVEVKIIPYGHSSVDQKKSLRSLG